MEVAIQKTSHTRQPKVKKEQVTGRVLTPTQDVLMDVKFTDDTKRNIDEMPRSLNLIVQADDFGYSAPRDDGILEGYRAGKISGASLMVNGSTAVSAAKRAAMCGLPLSLHLNLSEGIPVGRKSSLTGTDGMLRGKMETRQALESGEIKLVDVRNEIEAQLNKFRDLTGSLPVRFDGHQHIHIHPVILHVTAQVMHRARVRFTRIPIEPWNPIAKSSFGGEVPAGFSDTIYQQAIVAGPVYRSFGFEFPSYFIGMGTMGSSMTVERVTQILRSLPNPSNEEIVTCEWMVHPGYVTGTVGGCGGGPDDFSQSGDRKHELDVLLSDDLWNTLNSSLIFKVKRVRQFEWNDEQKNEDETNATNENKNNKPLFEEELPVCKDYKMLSCKETHVLVLAPSGMATGNATTALRFQSMFQSLGYTTSLIDPNYCTRQSLVSYIADQHVSLIVALHAFRAGKWLVESELVIPTIVVLGGTDVNCMLETVNQDDEVVMKIQLALSMSYKIVAFTTAMAKRASLALTKFADVDSIQKIVCVPQSAPSSMLEPIQRPCSSFSLKRLVGVPESARIVIQPCGIRPVKDPCFSFSCFKRLRVKHPDLVLVLLGPVLDRNTYEEVLKTARTHGDSDGTNLNSNVVYCPPLPHDQLLYAVQNEAESLLNTSVSEGMCNAILEAMAVGTPVVVRSNEGNCSLVDHNKSGIVFETEQELYDGLDSILSDADLGARLAKEARSFVENNLSERKEREAYRDILQKALSIQP